MRLGNLFFKKITLTYNGCPVGYRYRVEIVTDKDKQGISSQEYNFDVSKGGRSLDTKADEMIAKVGTLEVVTTGCITLSEVKTVNGSVLLVSEDDNAFGQVLECKDVVQLRRHIDYVCHIAAKELIESAETVVLNYSRLTKSLKNNEIIYQWVQKKGSSWTFKVTEGDDRSVLAALVSFEGLIEECLGAKADRVDANVFTIKVYVRGDYCFV